MFYINLFMDGLSKKNVKVKFYNFLLEFACMLNLKLVFKKIKTKVIQFLSPKVFRKVILTVPSIFHIL